MATPITVNIPHQLGRTEARRRIENGFAQITRLLPGAAGGKCTERWEGDRLVFGVTTLGQTVAGVVTVLDAVVTMEIELPGVLGLIAGGLKDRLQNAGQLLLTKKERRGARIKAFRPARAPSVARVARDRRSPRCFRCVRPSAASRRSD
jgi:hypothetical protein